MNRSNRRGRGQALVEFALVFPILALMIFGIIDFGRFVAMSNALSNSTREAARVASVGIRPSPQCDGLTRENCAIAVAKSNAWFVAPSAVIVPAPTCKRPPAMNTVSPCVTNDILTVKASTTFTPITPLIGQFIGGMPLKAETTVVVNQ
jgi:Flp pilus assembly protein TadG